MESAVAILMQQRFDLSRRFVPAFFEGSLADVLRHYYVSGVEFAVADNLDVWDVGNLLTDQFKDRTTKVSGDALVGLRALEPIGQEAVVEALAARGEAVDLSHARCLCLPSWCRIPLGLREHNALVHLGQRHRAGDATQV